MDVAWHGILTCDYERTRLRGVPRSMWRAYSCWPIETSTALGSGRNASVNVDPRGPVCTATVPLLACATPPTIALCEVPSLRLQANSDR
jgi:hypothetical protein